MTLITRKPWALVDGSTGQVGASLLPGRHRFERIPNPLHANRFWLVLPGTLLGGGERFWRDWDFGGVCRIDVLEGDPDED